MIVFIDGIDGSGKTTLIRNLAHALNDTGTEARVTEPLWRHLTAIAAPEEFASWVTRTNKADVASALMQAMVRRLGSLQEETRRQSSVLLVDRGPKTVYASARAHSGRHSPELAATRALLEKAVEGLRVTTSCVAVELTASNALDVTLPRLQRLQNVSPRYQQYLNAFAKEMRLVADWPGLPVQRLDVSASANYNCSETVGALQREWPS